MSDVNPDSYLINLGQYTVMHLQTTALPLGQANFLREAQEVINLAAEEFQKKMRVEKICPIRKVVVNLQPEGKTPGVFILKAYFKGMESQGIHMVLNIGGRS